MSFHHARSLTRGAALVATAFALAILSLLPPASAHWLQGVPDPKATAVPYDTRWYNQTLDHFRFTDTGKTFRQRYLWNDDNWGKPADPEAFDRPLVPPGCKGPLLFYSGNEGPIDAFWNSGGFQISTLAPKWGALVVFAELRYYGESLPFGPVGSFESDKVQYLSTEQGLADYAELVQHLKSTTPGLANCPVITFGGSYGGTLSTYLRLKYPNIFNGALAASAPIGYYANLGWKAHGIDEFTWIDIVNRDYAEAADGCLDTLSHIVKILSARGQSASGRAALAKIFGLCAPLSSAQPLVDWFTDAIETLPQMNYPYQVGSIPAWPVNHTCSVLGSTGGGDDDLLAAAAQITAFYYGQSSGACVSGVGQGAIPGGGPGPVQWGSWSYQSCTETLHRFSARGLRNYSFNMDWVEATCSKYWAARPNQLWAELHFGGGYDIAAGLSGISNVIWSNGLLDPWHGGGFLESSIPSCPVLIMPKGAHHLDLRAPHPEDPAQVTATRAKETEIIEGWLQDYTVAWSKRRGMGEL